MSKLKKTKHRLTYIITNGRHSVTKVFTVDAVSRLDAETLCDTLAKIAAERRTVVSNYVWARMADIEKVKAEYKKPDITGKGTPVVVKMGPVLKIAYWSRLQIEVGRITLNDGADVQVFIDYVIN